MTADDMHGDIAPIIRGRLKDLPETVYEATERDAVLPDDIDFTQLDSALASRFSQWVLGALGFGLGGISLYALIAIAGGLGPQHPWIHIEWLALAILTGVPAWFLWQQSQRSAAHAQALKEGPYRLGLLLSPSWLLVHRTTDQVTFVPVSRILAIKEHSTSTGGGSWFYRVRVDYTTQPEEQPPPDKSPKAAVASTVLDWPSNRHDIYDWWRDVQGRGPTDS